MARHEKQEQDYTKNPEQKVGPSHPRENSSLGFFFRSNWTFQWTFYDEKSTFLVIKFFEPDWDTPQFKLK